MTKTNNFTYLNTYFKTGKCKSNCAHLCKRVQDLHTKEPVAGVPNIQFQSGVSAFHTYTKSFLDCILHTSLQEI